MTKMPSSKSFLCSVRVVVDSFRGEDSPPSSGNETMLRNMRALDSLVSSRSWCKGAMAALFRRAVVMRWYILQVAQSYICSAEDETEEDANSSEDPRRLFLIWMLLDFLIGLGRCREIIVAGTLEVEVIVWEPEWWFWWLDLSMNVWVWIWCLVEVNDDVAPKAFWQASNTGLSCIGKESEKTIR